jgi:putative ABC transport system permease protein
MLGERFHNLRLRLKAVIKRRRLDRDLAEELEFHLAMREQKLIEQGMAPREARHAALFARSGDSRGFARTRQRPAHG